MVGRSRKLLGITSLLISLSLLTIKWIWHRQHMRFHQLNIQINELELKTTSHAQRMRCVSMLLKLSKQISTSTFVDKYNEYLQKHCIDINLKVPHSDQQIKEAFSPSFFERDKTTIIKKIYTLIISDKKYEKLIKTLENYINQDDFASAINILQQFPDCILSSQLREYKAILLKATKLRVAIYRIIRKLTQNPELN